jgi:ferredoxin
MSAPKQAGFFQRLFGWKEKPHAYAAPTPDSHVTPDPTRCVQCGVCGYNCPVGIPVRDYARQGKVVEDPRCVQCGQCIEVCPRGTLRWHSRSAEHFNLPEQTEYVELMRVFFNEGVEGQA